MTNVKNGKGVCPRWWSGVNYVHSLDVERCHPLSLIRQHRPKSVIVDVL